MKRCTVGLGLIGLVLTQIPARADSQGTYLQCLTNFETYAESIWHTASYSNAPADAGYWGDGASSGNGGIRGNGGVALAYAVLAEAYPGDPKLVTRLSRIRQALNYNAGAHVTGTNVCTDGHQWGWSSASSTDWQTPLWTGSMGLACLLVQNQLPASTVQAVQQVVASEATHRASIAPASGYVSDTKAEENGWDSNVLALGAAWLSSNTNAALWLTAAKKYLANTYTVANTNGDPLSSWISTVTLYPDFALENHGFYHPTYQMVAGMSMGDSLLMAQLANPTVATQLQVFAEHNVLNVWSNENHLVTWIRANLPTLRGWTGNSMITNRTRISRGWRRISMIRWRGGRTDNWPNSSAIGSLSMATARSSGQVTGDSTGKPSKPDGRPSRGFTGPPLTIPAG
jgi:hypothetical protein